MFWHVVGDGVTGVFQGSRKVSRVSRKFSGVCRVGRVNSLNKVHLCVCVRREQRADDDDDDVMMMMM